MSGLAISGVVFGRKTQDFQTPVAYRAAGVPARIMAPRILFCLCAVGLALFGLLMIYSASSILGLTDKACGYDAAFYLIKQFRFMAIGLVAAVVLACVDYHFWCERALRIVWFVTLLSLLLVYTPAAGHDAYGATRWIAIGSFSLQPSEFAKAVILLVGASLAGEFFERGTLENREMLKLSFLGVGLPLLLILAQPDKGTTGVLALTLLVMLYLAGFPAKYLGIILLVAVGLAAVIALRDDYSRARIMTVFDPFQDEFGAGYQLIQGFYALGSGGLTGVGLGMSRQKYNYLPMAHNDFIIAVIGEELGFVGVFLLLAAFGLLLWAGLKIAENASDLTGRLIAAGCTSLLVIQLLLNLSGVVGIFPLSGKPVPFISYGGSSIISSLILVGLVLSVSMHSTLPQTKYDERRAQMRIANNDNAFGYGDTLEGSTAGQATPRSRRGGHPYARRTDLRVLDGSLSRDLSRRPSYPVAKEPSASYRARTTDLQGASGGSRRSKYTQYDPSLRLSSPLTLASPSVHRNSSADSKRVRGKGGPSAR